jgi:HAD superfamily hydrolase (TIGR01490 family)
MKPHAAPPETEGPDTVPTAGQVVTTEAGPDTVIEARGVPGGTAAAFFDLDKTVIAKASMVAFSGPLHRAGLVSRRMLLRAAWGQLVYAQFGATPEKLAKLRDSVLRLTTGWDQAEITQIVRDTLVDVVEPIVFDEALELIREHKAAGRKVFIVSASPEEIVAPLAQYLGVDEALATRAELDERGRYTGGTELYCYGPDKVVAMAEAATRDGIDLAASYAYSDSATDLPMLEAVGNPVAVNPDRELLRAARANGWDVPPLRERVPMPAPRHAAMGGGAVAATVAAGLAARWLWKRRQSALAAGGGMRWAPGSWVPAAWTAGHGAVPADAVALLRRAWSPDAPLRRPRGRNGRT